MKGNLRYSIFWLLETKKIFNLIFLGYVDEDERMIPAYIWGPCSGSYSKGYRKT